MASDAAAFAVREIDGIPVIALDGDLDARCEHALEAAWADAVSGAPRAITLDFSGAGYINSTGIALLVGVLTKARQRHLALRAHGLSPHYREIFHITRIADYLEISDAEPGADASAAVRGAGRE